MGLRNELYNKLQFYICFSNFIAFCEAIIMWSNIVILLLCYRCIA
uniref:Uncharacterized protein n=1 Tax=Anguilla anguilla TaxID=7936 RepID=A0A0E9PIX9_ANGAN